MDGRSNNSGAELALPSANQLAKLAEQSRVVHPVTASVAGHEALMRSLRRRLTPDVRQEIVSRYVSGESAKALSQEFGISRDGVRRLLRDGGVTIRSHNVVTSQVAERIVHLYESGLTIRQVVEQVGYSFGTVQRVLNKHGGIMRVSRVGRRAAPDE